MSNSKFNKDLILQLKDKLNQKQTIPTTEEATKQWLIMPFIVALGYNPYSNEVIPEYTLDVGTKKGEKVDYAIQINNQPVMLIECKQLNTSLSDRHISQLYRYFTISDVHIAVLTNGDDYWFFTDSKKENVMDLEPYYTIKLSEITNDDLSKLEQYSKENVQYVDVIQVVQYERYITECKELVTGLRNNTIPTWLIDTLADRAGLFDVDKPTLAEYLYTEVQNQFNGYKVNKQDKKSNKHSKKLGVQTDEEQTLGDKMKETMLKNKENMSNIKINHEYVFNDYSDGDWKFHKLDYAIIFDTRYDNITARGLLVETIIKLFELGHIERESILKESQFDGGYKINAQGGFRGEHYLEKYDVYISTSYGISEIIKFIERLLDYCKLGYNNVIVSFKE